MRKMKAPAYFFSVFLLAALLVPMASTRALYAQAPTAGASVAVRMVEAVDSSKDPAGKQYRALVTRAVDAGNGVTIPQGAVAAVTLANSGSGYAAHLASVTINGQPVSVASGSASVTAGVQGAASSAMSSVSSMLGGFGHHVSAPTGVAAVATGQRVVLPPGTALTFVLSQPPAAIQAAPAAPAGQPMTASTAPAASPAASSASGPMRSFRCYYHGQKITHDLSAPADNQIVYVTPIFHAAKSTPVIQDFKAYMPTAYDLSKIEGATSGCDVDVQANVVDSQEKQWKASKTEVVHVNWTGSPAELAAATATAAATAPATASAGGPFISCSTRGTAGVAIYVTGIFQTTLPVKQLPNGAKFVDQSVLDHFHAYLTQQGYKFTPGSNGGCDVSPTEAAAEAAQHTRIHGGNGSCGYCGYKVVETGWKDQ